MKYLLIIILLAVGCIEEDVSVCEQDCFDDEFWCELDCDMTWNPIRQHLCYEDFILDYNDCSYWVSDQSDQCKEICMSDRQTCVCAGCYEGKANKKCPSGTLD